MKRGVAQTLWDLLLRRPVLELNSAGIPKSKGERPMQRRYDELVIEMKKTHGVRVVKWRNSTSGCAWEVSYGDGTVRRLIEAPYPRGPMSCAVFLHEIGHHAIGLRTYRPRCLEEFHAWRWALVEMEQRGLNVTEGVRKRRDAALRYAVGKAVRRGLKKLPSELVPYLEFQGSCVSTL